MGWRIVYIEEAMNAKLYLDNIRIETDTNEIIIPLKDIHTLVIDNYKLSITIQLMLKCSEYNVNVVLCGMEHMPKALVLPIIGNYQAPKILKQQIQWSEEMKKKLHRLIIINKIENQALLLKYFGKNKDVIEKLFSFSREVEDADIGNREGLSAKMYFRELFGNDFKRFEENVINAGLNYGYAILRSQISKTIISKGLNASIGIIHIGYDNAFNLSDDIIEVFRPLIDEYVYKYLVDAIIFKKENRLDLIRKTTGTAIINGSKQTIFNTISIYVERIIEAFEKNDETLYQSVRLIHEL